MQRILKLAVRQQRRGNFRRTWQMSIKDLKGITVELRGINKFPRGQRDSLAISILSRAVIQIIREIELLNERLDDLEPPPQSK
jgi:hypothetical protein